MKTLNVMLSNLGGRVVPIGYEGENLYTRIRINCIEVFSEYPDATVSMVVSPPVGEMYPAVVEKSGVMVIWDITDSVLSSNGSGECQLTFTEGNVVRKSVVFGISINRSLVAEGDPPDPVQDWIENASEVLQSLENISASATTLESDQDATAEITEVGGHKNIAIGVPRGATGAKGDPGESFIASSNDTPAAVMTVSDGADNQPMGITVAINPVQDLHGYANPWAGGAGKNIAPVTVSNIKSANTLGTWVDNVYTQANVEFTILTDDAGNVTGIKANGTPNANIGFYIFKDKTIPTGTYTLTGNPVDATTSHDIWLGTFANDAYRDYDYGTGSTVTLSSDTTLSLRFRIASGSQVSNIEIKPMIRLSTETDVTFAPYENICPISGWDSVQITRTGKNLFDRSTEELYSLTENGGSGSNTSFKHSKSIPVKAGEKYTWSLIVGFATQAHRIIGYDANGNYKQQVYGSTSLATGNQSTTITIPSEVHYVKLSYREEDTNIQFEYGETATTYTAFIGSTTYPISLPTTAYGGTLTVNKDGSGTIVVDYAFNEFDGSNDESWTKDGSRYKIEGCTGIKGASGTRLEITSNIGSFSSSDETVGTIFGYASGNLYYYPPTSVTSTAEFKTWLASNNLQVLYELASPVSYDFTAQQIRSLLGENNLWADSGNVLNVVYYADVKMYIDNLFNSILPATGVSF